MKKKSIETKIFENRRPFKDNIKELLKLGGFTNDEKAMEGVKEINVYYHFEWEEDKK